MRNHGSCFSCLGRETTDWEEQMTDMVEGLIVETAAGKLRGASSNGISAFKGIPYGAPTGGANRFMPPRPPAPWTGIREATSYYTQAPQLPGRPERRPE